MSVSLGESGTPFQPYQCGVCLSRFTRHENLKRHAAVHSRGSREGSLMCSLCSATFSRADLRRRHMRRKHGDLTIPGITTETTAALPPEDRSSRQASSTASPADSHGHSPTLFDHNSFFDTTLPTSQFGLPPLLNGRDYVGSADTTDGTTWWPSPAQINEGCRLFFQHISPFLPIIHQPTFDVENTPRSLMLAMLALAYQYGENPDHDERTNTHSGADTSSGTRLSLRCFQSAHSVLAAMTTADSHLAWIDSASAASAASAASPASKTDRTAKTMMVQAYLMLQVTCMLYLCTEAVDGLALHSKMISLARAGGLMQPLTAEAAAEAAAAAPDLEALWRQAMEQEACKRTLFAVHQIDALWYQLLSLPRSVSHLEFKHDLPCPKKVWTAPSAAAWAHRQLAGGGGGGGGGGCGGGSGGAGGGTVVDGTGRSLPYTDVVRLFLTSDVDHTALATPPSLEAFGVINVVQFLISSAREISGWSTMTGMLSIERIQPLKASLAALRPFIHAHPSEMPSACSGDSTDHTAALMCEATWEMAMIELQLWSPAHTRGMVGKTLAAVLDQSVHLDPVFLFEANTAKAMQPHIDWFLHYLDIAAAPAAADPGEAPWIALYAYKAFQIAWQLLCRGFPGAMQAVDVPDGDRHAALHWARKVFRWRGRWQLGRQILQCLEKLEERVDP